MSISCIPAFNITQHYKSGDTPGERCWKTGCNTTVCIYVCTSTL